MWRSRSGSRAILTTRRVSREFLARAGSPYEIIILDAFGDSDDRPAGLFMRVLVALPSAVVATAAAVLERVLQNAVDIKAENDLTV